MSAKRKSLQNTKKEKKRKRRSPRRHWHVSAISTMRPSNLATRLLMTLRVIGGYGVSRWFVSSDLFFPFRPIFGIDGHLSAGPAVTTITNPKSDFVYYPMTLGLYLRLIFFSTSLFHCLLLFPMLGIFSSAVITHRLLFYSSCASPFFSCRYIIISIRLCTSTPHPAAALSVRRATKRLGICARGVNTSLH